MSDAANGSPEPRNVVAGAALGALGGLAGAAVKGLCEAIVPPRTPERDPPPGVLAEKLVRAFGGSGLSKERKGTISLAVHWIFSTLTSALYGATVARFPQVRFANGVAYGLLVWAGLHELTLPLLGATPPLSKLPANEQMNEFVTHALFGVAVESVRANMARLLG